MGALALNACIEGAWLNVKINAADIKKHPRVVEILEKGMELLRQAEETKTGIIDRVNEKIGQ